MCVSEFVILNYCLNGTQFFDQQLHPVESEDLLQMTSLRPARMVEPSMPLQFLAQTTEKMIEIEKQHLESPRPGKFCATEMCNPSQNAGLPDSLNLSPEVVGSGDEECVAFPMN